MPSDARSLHSLETVFSLRHAPTWLALAASAGAVNVLAYLACSRFVTHVTGTVTHVGIDLGTRSVLAVDYTLVLAAFVAGAFVASAAIDGRAARGKTPLHAVPLVAVAAVLALVALLGDRGAFGPYGSSVETTSDFGLLSMLGFAMGLQNASVATSTGLIVRTTHLTGPATDLGIHLALALYGSAGARKIAFRHAALRAGKIASFAIGGAAGAVLARRVAWHAFLVPAGIVLGATALSFMKDPQRVGGELSS